MITISDGSLFINKSSSFLLLFELSYIIQNGVCYMTICDRSYPRQLAFSYLEELAKEFFMSYGNDITKKTLRPYAFVKFGKGWK